VQDKRWIALNTGTRNKMRPRILGSTLLNASLHADVGTNVLLGNGRMDRFYPSANSPSAVPATPEYTFSARRGTAL